MAFQDGLDTDTTPARELGGTGGQQGRRDPGRLALLLAHLDEIVLLTTADGSIIDCNPTAEHSYGYPREALLTMSLSDLCPGHARLALAAELAATRSKDGHRFETVQCRQGGGTFPVEATVTVVTLEGEAVIIGILRDLTEHAAAPIASSFEAFRIHEAHEAAVAALRASETRHRELFERIRSGVAVYEAVRGGEDFVFRDLNRAAEQIEQVTRADVVSRPVTEVFPGVVEFGLLEVLRRVWRTGTPEHFPMALYHDERVTGWRENYVYRLPSGEIVAVYDDVTERKRAEEALRASEQEFRTIFEATNDAIYIHDLEGRILEVNQAASHQLGYTREELGGMAAHEIDSPGQARFVPERIAALQERGRLVFATEHRRKGGSTVPIEVSASIIEYRGVPAVLSICRDISERRQAETALRYAATRWSSTFDAIQDGICLLDPRGRVLQFNQAFLTLVNLPPDRVFGRPCHDLVHASEAFAACCPFQRMLTTSKHEEVEQAIGDRWFHISVDPVLDDAGMLEGAVHIMSDVTLRVHADEERRRLVAAVEQAAETIVITDLEGRIQFVNPAFTAVTGYTRDEVLGQNPRLLKSGQQPPEKYRELWATLLSGHTWHGHLVNRRKDGSLFEEDATISPVRDAAGRLVNFVAVKRDITQEVALEAQLRQAQKIEAVGSLAGGVAHDFNNLLQAMLSAVEIMRSQPGDAERALDRLGELEENIRRGAQLTRQLLLFSRREAARTEQVDLNEVLHSAATMLRRLLRENIAFSLELAGRQLAVEADRGQIEQVVTNLALNAADAMPDGGKLTIRTGRNTNGVWFEVQDTGAGIPHNVLERIFEPFFTTKAAGKGTGLGLAVVHGIVAAHQGHIDIDTTVGVGTRIRVSLPRATGTAGAAPDDELDVEQAVVEGGGERVLVVEDEPGARDGLRDILTFLGYRVETAPSGEDALSLPVEPGFEILLTDVMLPGTSGLEVARQLGARWPGLKVILMSGYAADETLRRGVTAGHLRFLQKPFDMATLAREIRAALEG